MRNRITPGDTENWSVTVTDNTGRPTEAAMIFDMYAKDLDTLAPLSWRSQRPIGANRTLHDHVEAVLRSGHDPEPISA